MHLRAIWTTLVAGAMGSLLAAPAWPAMGFLFIKIIGEIVMSNQ